MASRRYRRNTSVGTRILSLESDVTDAKKKSKVGENEILPGNIDENAVDRAAIAPGAVGTKEVERGAIGTEHLGIINEINADGNLVINTPGKVILQGDYYGQITLDAPPTTNLAVNGSFRINQRGYVSGDALIPGLYTGYGHDRWRSAGRTNLVPNPRAFTTETPWAGSNVTISRITGVSIPALPGVTTAVRATATAAATGGLYTQGDSSALGYINVVAGQEYRVSIWLRSSVAKTIQPSIQWSGGPTNTNYSSVALTANVWTEVVYTFTAPQGAIRAGLYWYSTTAWAVGNTLDGTGLIMTEGTDVVPFFDADTPGCTSTGTLYQTPSTNRAVVTSYAFTQAPNGCTVTINSGGAIQQVIERANMPAGEYTLSWEGTAQARAFPRGALYFQNFSEVTGSDPDGWVASVGTASVSQGALRLMTTFPLESFEARTSRIFAVTEGYTYTFAASARSASSGSAGFVQVDGGAAVPLGGTTFAPVSVTFVATSSSAVVTLGGTSYWDDITLTQGPVASLTSPLTFTTDGTNDIVVEFEAVGGTATLGGVNLVAGTTAYPFRLRPLGEELALAQRYYWRLDNPADSGVNIMVCLMSVYGVQTFYGPLPMPVTMRQTPVGRSDGGSAFLLFYSAVNSNSTAIQFHDSSPDIVRILAFPSGSSTPGYSAWAELRPSYWLDFTAEF